jgi:signal transduction histidine kinase
MQLIMLPSYRTRRSRVLYAISLLFLLLSNGLLGQAGSTSTTTKKLVQDAAALLERKGAQALADFQQPGSRWRQPDHSIFVLDERGNLLVHPDPRLEGKRQHKLKDADGRLIVRQMIEKATAYPERIAGWYHFVWPAPGSQVPRWVSNFIQRVETPAGKRLIVGSGIYTDRTEADFVVDMVDEAVSMLERRGKAGLPLLYDPRGAFLARDAYVFVLDSLGRELANPAFPNMVGRSMIDHTDADGRLVIRGMFDVVGRQGSGWVDYRWPRPGDHEPSRKSTYVRKARLDGTWVLVGSGYYNDSDRINQPDTAQMNASQLMRLVRDAAGLLEAEGEQAFPTFRKQGSRWFQDETYLFVWDLSGKRVFHALEPQLEGASASDRTDVLGRPFGRMILDAARSDAGEGWVHYMHPIPGQMLPSWKTVFVKRVVFPSGQEHLLGCGLYNMQMEETFIEDVVNRASRLVAARGPAAFPVLRDRKGPYYFMDTYVFVTSPMGVELVNPAQSSLEGKNILSERDINGFEMVKAYLEVAAKEATGWVSYFWYKPENNRTARKFTFVRSITHKKNTYIVGAGMYEQE